MKLRIRDKNDLTALPGPDGALAPSDPVATGAVASGVLATRPGGDEAETDGSSPGQPAEIKEAT